MFEILVMWIFQIFFTFGSCNSLCSIVSSEKHGHFSQGKSGEFRPECVSDLGFENQETEEYFCLSKKINVSEKLQCVGVGHACKCGQENRHNEALGVEEVGVVGGEKVGEHQYPWYALVFMKKTSKTGVTSSKYNYL